MRYKKKHHPRILSKDQIKAKAKDLIHNKMMFYYEKSENILKKVYTMIVAKDTIQAAKLLIELGKVDDRFEMFASKLLPYQDPKLSSIEINKNVTKRYVIVAPRIIPNAKNWLKAVETDKLALPPPVVPQPIQQEENLNGASNQDDSEDLEYQSITQY